MSQYLEYLRYYQYYCHHIIASVFNRDKEDFDPSELILSFKSRPYPKVLKYWDT